MAAPQLLPEDFDADELEEELDEEPEDYEEEYEEIDTGDDDRSDRLDEIKEKAKEKAKEKFKEKREQKKQAKEEAKKAEADKPPKQETKPEDPDLKRKKLDKTKTEADKVKSGEQKLSKATGEKAAGEGGQAAAKTAGKTAGKEAAAVGKKGGKQAAKAAGKAASKAAKVAAQAAKAMARAAAQAVRAAAAATVEFWGPVVVIILIIIVIIAVIFILFSFSRETGKGPATYPETALQQQQSNFLLAVSGDKIAQDTIVKDVIESELARYDRMKENANLYSPAFSSKITEKKNELEIILNSALAEQNTELRKEVLEDARTQMRSFENSLPFGSWIAKMAEERVGQDNIGFCLITGATAKVACASFVSTIMYLAGVPNAIVANTTAVWNNSALGPVIARANPKSETTYNEGLLKPGDVIWWGDGTCSTVKYKGKLFDHIGIYVGNGLAIDTSSSAEKIIKRVAAKRGNCRLFNGAKRYGS